MNTLNFIYQHPVFYVLFAIQAIALLLVAYFLGFRKARLKERCSSQTTGEVIRYSFTQYSGVKLPVCQYNVDGMDYQVTGPKFKWVFEITKSNPFAPAKADKWHNIPETGPLPDTLKVTYNSNSMVSIKESPLMDRYPIGSQVQVFYNPNKPKEAYVERFTQPSMLLVGWFPLIIGIGLILLMILSVIFNIKG